MDPKIIITGTGRTGTSALVELFTALNFNTGFYFDENGQMKPEDRFRDHTLYNSRARAGWELLFPPSSSKEQISSLPKVLKSPFACYELDELIMKDKIDIEYLIVPVRDLKKAAQSRTQVGKDHGGQWLYEGELDLNKQYFALCYALATLQCTIVKHSLPTIWLWFPKFIEDASYCFKELQPILNNDLGEEKFVKVHSTIFDPNKITIK